MSSVVSRPNRRPAVCEVLLVGLYFFAFAGQGVLSDFFPDDMMNIYGYWSQPLGQLVRDTFLPFFSEGRGLGGWLYAPLFRLFGLNPLPYRLACFSLLIVNLYLAWRVACLVTRSATAALVATVIFSYHAYMSDLYYSTASVYDLLLFLCYWATFLVYQKFREQPSGLRACSVLTLYLLALAAKETAATLPVILAAYEWLERPHSPRASSPRVIGIIGVMSAIAVLYLVARLAGASAVTWNPAYAPNFDVHEIWSNWRDYTGKLFYLHDSVSSRAAGTVLSALVALPAVARSRRLAFCSLLILVTTFPVLLITPRSAYVLYLPFLGWAIYVGEGFAGLARALPRRIPVPADWKPLMAGLLAACCLAPFHLEAKPRASVWISTSGFQVRTVLREIDKSGMQPRPGARILILDDPVDTDDFLLTFVFRLRFRDDSLDIRRVKQMNGAPPCDEQKEFDHLCSLTGWKLVLYDPKTRCGS